MNMVHYEPVKVTINTLGLAKVIFNMVVYYYRLPNSILPDRGLLFIFKVLVITLLFLRGQTEALNRLLFADGWSNQTTEQHDRVVSQAVINYKQVQINIKCTGLRFGHCAQTFDLHGSSAKEVLEDGHATAVTIYAFKKNLSSAPNFLLFVPDLRHQKS